MDEVARFDLGIEHGYNGVRPHYPVDSHYMCGYDAGRLERSTENFDGPQLTEEELNYTRMIGEDEWPEFFG